MQLSSKAPGEAVPDLAAPRFSVSGVIATRDRPQLLRRAIRSMLAQDGRGLVEIIVVFDQVEPDSDLLDEFAGANIRLARNVNSPGLPGARNTGIDLARGDWVAFCDDDDEWSHDKLRQQCRVIDGHTDFVVSGIRIAYGDRSVVRTPGEGPLVLSRLLRSRVMEAHPSTFLIRKSALAGSLGPVDEELPGGYYEDYDLLLRAARLGPIAVADAPLTIVNWHSHSFYKNRWAMINDSIDYLIEKTAELQTTRAGLARLRGQQAFALAGLGERRAALQRASETFRLDPRQLRSYLTLLVVAGLKAEWLVKFANTLGRGI